ncbi:RagB/SusD family nutrient uptake outer membrane protein [Sediminibacterium soli]|uniref:RagB/SusD family nutrient uptake outer membrane protein n=1 Tax=Sediminibacterium soli TaxID=2698829 RepID=UPI00137ABA9B|nr:RagB/SusD family nutrient uptake outer membrane protein [Sediminibacterium soli]NCI46780.1 RagB/SusD family nutrient uptake outer membrane protein [Sediminibacterium soli]
MKAYKNKWILTAALAGSVIMSGCTKLDEKVYSELLAQNFQATPQDVPALIAPVYTVLRAQTASWQALFDVEEESADQIVTPARPNGWVDGGTYRRMHEHVWTPTEGQPNGVYNRSFTGINNANRVLFQINSGEIPVSNGKDAIIAELRAARAYYYYLLLDNHANVPIVTDFKDTSLPKQSTRQQVYDFVVKEFTEAMPNLTTEVSKRTYGRMNRWAAKAFLARVYLNAQVYTGTAKWAECIQQCNDVIASNSYSLAARYKDNFTATNDASPEMVFAVPYDEIMATENNLHMKTLDPLMQLVYPMQVQPWGGNCAVPQWIDTYDADDQRLKDTWIMGPQYNATTGALVINYVKTVTSIASSTSNQGFRIGKYEIKPGMRGGSSVDFPLMRYADVLMMKAECLLRTGLATEAATIVSQVRARSFTANPAKATVTAAQLQMGSSYNYGEWAAGAQTTFEGGADIPFGRMLDELGWEFAAEAKRRQDIIRFGVFNRKSWFSHKPSPAYRSIFPIPNNSLLTNSNLKQNPGY